MREYLKRISPKEVKLFLDKCLRTCQRWLERIRPRVLISPIFGSCLRMHVDIKGKIQLDIYAEIYKLRTPQMETAIEAAVYDQLGEKTVGLEIASIVLCNLFHLSTEDREKLLPIGQLPMHVRHQELSSLTINEKGTLQ